MRKRSAAPFASCNDREIRIDCGNDLAPDRKRTGGSLAVSTAQSFRQALQPDEATAAVTIIAFAFVREVDGTKTYSVSSFKPADPDNFVLAGSRRQEEDGWIHATEFATFTAAGELHFSTSP